MAFYPFTGSSGGGFQPWQFQPETYGAKGDGIVLADVSITSGQNTATSVSRPPATADAGKYLMINGALGTTAGPLIAKVNSVSGGNWVLAASATASVSGGSAFLASDDTAAINTCVTAAATYAQANKYKAQIVFGAKYYGLASGPTQFGDGSTVPTFNSQIPLPYGDATGAKPKLVLEFLGAGDASQCQFFSSSTPNLQGTCLVSMVLAPGTGGTAPFGAQSVIGGPTSAAGFTGTFANMKPVIRDIMLVCGWGAQQIGYDFRFTGGASVDRSSYQALAAVAGNAPTLATIPTAPGTNSIALYMPTKGNNDDCYVGQFTAECVSYGVAFSEHFNAQKVTCIYCNVGAFVADPGGVIIHGGSILYYSCEATNIALQTPGSTNTQFPLNIAMMDTEVINTWDIQDSSSMLTGIIHWADFERTTMNVQGAAGLKIINDRLTPGIWAGAPAAPANNTAQQNTAWRDATIYLSATTGITAVKIGSTTTGLTAGSGATVALRVPAGQSYTVTYTGTLTTTWWLD